MGEQANSVNCRRYPSGKAMQDARTDTDAIGADIEKGTWAWLEAPGKRFLEGIARYWYIVLPAIFFCAALPMLGARPFRFEEGRRVAQVLAFFDGGSWLRPEIFGEAYTNKPPLLPWLIAIVAKALGHVDEFAARLPSVIAIASTILTAGLMASRVAVHRRHLAAFAAGTFAMVAPVVISRYRLAETDATATAFAGAAFLVWALSRLRHNGNVGFLSWCGVAACCGGALLAKGPPPLLFPLVPMFVIPLQERRWGEIRALVLALIAGSLPLAWWLLANIDVTSAAHLSSELRLRPNGLSGFGDYLKGLPELIIFGPLQFLPGLALCLIWIGSKASWRRNAGWLNQALFLFAVPTSVLLLFWPTSEARYIMPAVWPISVMAGLLVAEYWSRTGMSTILVATLITFLVVQGVQLVIEGRTAKQVAQRQAATALAAAVEPLPAGGWLIWSGEKPDYNLYVYMRRNATLVTDDTLSCKPDSAYLLADDTRTDMIDPGIWSKLTAIEGADMTLYRRQAGATGC